MAGLDSRKSDFAYLKDLVGAAWDGISAARGEMQGSVFTPPLQNSVWRPVSIGAGIGMLGAVATKRKSAARLAMGALAGGAVGFGVALASASRQFAGFATHGALRRVNAVRDARWIETHPIDYA